MEGEPRLVARKLVRRAERKEDLTAVQDAVPALVGEGDAVLVYPGQEERAARSPPRAAHLELIGEVAGELVLDPVVDVVDEEVGEGEPLDELLVGELLAAQVQEVHRIGEDAPEREAGDGEIDLRSIFGGRLRRQHDGRAPRYRQPQPGEGAGGRA